jgi:serralysin
MANPYYVDALVADENYRWNKDSAVGTPVEVTFSFMQSLPDYYNPTGGSWNAGGFTANNFRILTATEQAAVRAALEVWERVCGIDFVEVVDSSAAQMRFGVANDTTGNSIGWGYLPTGTQKAGDVWLDDNGGTGRSASSGSELFNAILHEIGHAIGLEHSFEGGLVGNDDSYMKTVMAYPNTSPYGDYYPSTIGVYDIAAAQYLYGKPQVGTDATTGNNVYTVAQAQPKIQTIYDGGGTDTIDLSNWTRAVKLDLRQGKGSNIGGEFYDRQVDNYWVAYGTRIENGYGGSGNDRINGNALDNYLKGNSGDDLLYGDRGNDRLYGDGGNDKLYGDSGNDGLIGQGGNDVLVGGDGNDFLYAAGGRDNLVGGTGADRYIYKQSSGRVADTITGFRVTQDAIGIDTADGTGKIIKIDGTRAKDYYQGRSFSGSGTTAVVTRDAIWIDWDGSGTQTAFRAFDFAKPLASTSQVNLSFI